jgi:Zn-dependent peptidase ImmA (M78 family)/DNA-binding XRE family transcriptional regulator
MIWLRPVLGRIDANPQVLAMAAKGFSIDVNPDVLRWARESAGRKPAAVAERLGISEQLVVDWETGKKSPQWRHLGELAEFYQRPVGALLLAAPPAQAVVPPDFRTLPQQQRELSPSTLLAIRTARWLQGRAIEIRRELGLEAAFRANRTRFAESAETVAQAARQTLGVDLSEQTEWTSPNQAYRRWREAVEAQGVLVFQFPFPVEEVRGFSLFDPLCPVIVVNESDAVLARVFTLFHEYAHLLLEKPGICLPEEALSTNGASVEPYCNQFAAALLVPNEEIVREVSERRAAESDSLLQQLANRYSVSKYVVLFRLTALGRLAKSTARAIERRWKARDEGKFVDPRTSKGGGATAVNICRRQRGQAFIGLVQEAERRGLITMHDAATYLHLRAKDLKKLESSE